VPGDLFHSADYLIIWMSCLLIGTGPGEWPRDLLRAALLVIGGILLVAATTCALVGCRLGAVIPLAFWGTIFGRRRVG
jgi:hypothetical protein